MSEEQNRPVIFNVSFNFPRLQLSGADLNNLFLLPERISLVQTRLS